MARIGGSRNWPTSSTVPSGSSRLKTTGLKKIKSFGLKERQLLIDRNDRIFSLRRLLGLNCSSLCYTPVGTSEGSQRLMNLLNEQYTRTPFWGVRNMTTCLRKPCGCRVGKDHMRIY